MWPNWSLSCPHSASHSSPFAPQSTHLPRHGAQCSLQFVILLHYGTQMYTYVSSIYHTWLFILVLSTSASCFYLNAHVNSPKTFYTCCHGTPSVRSSKNSTFVMFFLQKMSRLSDACRRLRTAASGQLPKWWSHPVHIHIVPC